jgi:hypothetical protein
MDEHSGWPPWGLGENTGTAQQEHTAQHVLSLTLVINKNNVGVKMFLIVPQISSYH